MVEPTGFEPAKLATRALPRATLGLGKRASLLGPHWLFRCIRNPCALDTNEPDFTPIAFRFCDCLRRTQACGPILGTGGESRTPRKLVPETSASTFSPRPQTLGAAGFEPATYRSQTGRATYCAMLRIPLSGAGQRHSRLQIPAPTYNTGAAGGTRTLTPWRQRSLNPPRLPFRHCRRGGICPKKTGGWQRIRTF